MWLLLSRTPRPDAPSWRGRRSLAAIDAIAWPLAWIAAATHLPNRGGAVGAVIVAAAVVAALGRLRRALCRNHRYYFTMWRWGRLVVALLVGG